MNISPVPFHIEHLTSKIWGLLKCDGKELIIEYQVERLKANTKVKILTIPIRLISQVILKKSTLTLQLTEVQKLVRFNNSKQGRCHFTIERSELLNAELFIEQLKILVEESKFNDKLA